MGTRTRASWWVLLSGGFDSATVLAAAVADGVEAHTLFVDYGQGAHEQEMTAARAIACHYGAEHGRLRVEGLDVRAGEIKGRNAALCAIALAAVPTPATIAIGIHRGSPYWDCGEGFLSSMQALADGYTNGELQFSAPLLDLVKPEIYALGEELSVPAELTYSCERGGAPCGACASCLDVEAYARA